MCPKDADGIANSVDPDQTAPLGSVWSGSALFAKTCQSENLGALHFFRCPDFSGTFAGQVNELAASNIIRHYKLGAISWWKGVLQSINSRTPLPSTISFMSYDLLSRCVY